MVNLADRKYAFARVARRGQTKRAQVQYARTARLYGTQLSLDRQALSSATLWPFAGAHLLHAAGGNYGNCGGQRAQWLRKRDSRVPKPDCTHSGRGVRVHAGREVLTGRIHCGDAGYYTLACPLHSSAGVPGV